MHIDQLPVDGKGTWEDGGVYDGFLALAILRTVCRLLELGIPDCFFDFINFSF